MERYGTEKAEGAEPASPTSLRGRGILGAQKKVEDWRKYYTEERPHGAIGNKTPTSVLNHVGASSPPS